MHYQDPPLIHRDLKVENILLTPPQTYKLCDFGSTTKPLPRDKVPTTVEGIQKIELEINKTTTLQYRAPELVDVWGRKGYDEKIGACLSRANPGPDLGHPRTNLHNADISPWKQTSGRWAFSCTSCASTRRPSRNMVLSPSSTPSTR